jgi:protein-S-isoprenylcysteine O-methyltransferase Ste14
MASEAQAVEAKGWLKPATADRIEQVLIVLFWSWLAWRVMQSENPFAWMLLASESLIAFFVLIRRPTEALSMKPFDWAVAVGATLLPLMVSPAVIGPEYLVVPGVIIFFFGSLTQISAKLFLNRSFGIAPANRGIKVSGVYRLVRHPMYLGYITAQIGLLLLFPSIFNAAIYGVAFVIQVIRVLAEERILSQDPEYRSYMEKVRWRIVPGIF